MDFISHSEIDTINFGQKISQQLSGGVILCLEGNLGAGKTTLVKGIAEGLGVKEEIKSPTFTLMNVYLGNKLKLVHIDTYRLKNEQELIGIGATDYLGTENTIAIVEWPEKIAGLLKNKKVMTLKIEHLDENKRKIILA